MEKTLKYIVVGLGILGSLAFKIGDEIELTQFLNARSQPNFIKKSNIVKTLKAGTTGEVSDIKRFYSGNMGFKMKITSGPNAGETHWVYYNVKSPSIILSTKSGKEIPEEKITDTLVEDENVNSKLEEDTNGYQDPSETLLTDVTDFPRITQEKIEEVLKPKLSGCDDILSPKITHEEIAIMDVDLNEYRVFDSGTATVKYQSDAVTTPDPFWEVKSEITKVSLGDPDQSNNPQEAELPKTDANVRPEKAFDYPRCGNKDSLDFQTCYAHEQLEGINLSNSGPNAINPDGDYYINRTFDLTFNDKSLSDSTLMITDNPNERVSSSTYSLLMVFPRTQLPEVKSNGKEIEMTLSNGEVVKFDAKSKQIIGGVLTEGPMKVDGRRKALPADISYKGEGVLIRADRNNGLPMGNDEDKTGRPIANKTVAVVSKKGFKDCKIPSNDLWYDDQKLKRILIKPEYSTDEGLDKLLKARCGFTIN